MTTTPTLGLTQYGATDTMNFLTQYNTDLSKIDTNAKMTKAIGSDYIYSYTTPPSYSGGTVTIYGGTKFVCADGRDANGDIKQTVSTLSTNKTIALTVNGDYNIFINDVASPFDILNANCGIVSFVSNLPSSVPTTSQYAYYVINEHRYYFTKGSTTPSWVAAKFCKVASVRVTSSTITYFKPNLQLNLAQKIGKDKLLMTMADVNANTDKEFVPSAVAVKEMLATLGVDYIVEKGSNANGNYEKWNSGKLVMWGKVITPTLNYTATGQIFYAIYNLQLPIIPIGSCEVFTSIKSAEGAWGSSMYTDVNSSGVITLFILKPSNVSASETISFHAVGSWK